MNWDQMQGLIRHALTVGAGYLASVGVIGGSDVEVGVGALMGLLGIGWSVYSKAEK